MDFKIRFSDIIKHIGLGVAMCSLSMAIIPEIEAYKQFTILPVSENISTSLKNVMDSFGIVVGQILLLIFTYVIGLLVQTLINILYGKGFNGMSITEYCFFAKKFGRLSDEDYPDWVFWSSRPDNVLRKLTEQTEFKLDSETRSEWLILNQLFEGIYFILMIGLLTFTSLSSEIPIEMKVVLFSIIVFQFIASRLSYFICRPSYSLVLAFISSVLFIITGIFLCEAQFHNRYVFMSVGMALTFICARYFAKCHLLSMGNISASDKESLNDLLRENGLPTAFVLIRTNSARYIQESLNSIGIQDYPSIKTIILQDAKPKSKSETAESIQATINAYKNDNNALNILYYTSNKSGPMALSEEIYDIFLKNSDNGDISIMLDSDDYLASKDVISKIISKIYRSKAGICITPFELFGKISLNYAKDYHNVLTKRIAKLRLPLNYSWLNRMLHKDLIDDIYHISTIGWVKSYRREVIDRFIELKRSTGYDYFVNTHGLTIYEDFPDILAIISCKEGITAIPSPSHRFRKEEGSVTTNVNVENYKTQIPGFLAVTCFMVKNAPDSIRFPKSSLFFIRDRFTVYKFIQYLDIVINKENIDDPCLNMPDGKGRFTAVDFVQSYLTMINDAECETRNGEWLKQAYEKENIVIKKENIMAFNCEDQHIDVINKGINAYNRDHTA